MVSLATDKGVWDAVLANEKIKEFRRNFSAPASEDGVSGAMEQKVRGSRKNNVFSRFYWKSKQAFANFIASFQDFMAALFETADKKAPGGMSASEKSGFLDRTVKACMMLAVLVLAVVVFKRSANFKRG